jgi:hypothetical protein
VGKQGSLAVGHLIFATQRPDVYDFWARIFDLWEHQTDVDVVLDGLSGVSTMNPTWKP